jgi:uncharacterized membrane protein (DUF4010 family)
MPSSMDLEPLLLSTIAAAGLGAMIGLIRQWSEQASKKNNGEFSGVRTFTFWSVLGCVAAFLSQEYSAAVLPVIVAMVGIHLALQARKEDDSAPGSTTFAATLLTMLIGALVQWEHGEEAALLAALTVVLLGIKHPVHAWTKKFNETDIRATLQFVAITGVILPLVPNEDFGPYGGFNPYSTWMMVVLISGVGFAGYVMMRLLDTSAGIVLTSVLGGVASSTATTLAFSRRSREDPASSAYYAMGVAIACTIMLPRVLVLLGLIHRPLAMQLLLPFGAMAVPGVACAVFIWWRQHGRKHQTDQPTIGNPLSLMTAIKFAAIYAVISFLVKAAAESGHLQNSLLPLAFVSGLTDLDAIALSVARNLNSGEEGLGLAARAIIVAAISNSLLKGVLAVSLGRGALRWYIAIMMAGTIAAGVLAAIFLVGGGESGAD